MLQAACRRRMRSSTQIYAVHGPVTCTYAKRARLQLLCCPQRLWIRPPDPMSRPRSYGSRCTTAHCSDASCYRVSLHKWHLRCHASQLVKVYSSRGVDAPDRAAIDGNRSNCQGDSSQSKVREREWHHGSAAARHHSNAAASCCCIHSNVSRMAQRRRGI